PIGRTISERSRLDAAPLGRVCRVDQHQARDTRGMPYGEQHCCYGAKSFSDQDGFVEAELTKRRQNVHDLDLVGLAPPRVDAADAVARRQLRGEQIDDIATWRKRVRHVHQWPVETRPVAQPQPGALELDAA